MQRGAAIRQNYARDVAQFGRIHVQAAKFRRVFFLSESAAHRVPHRVRLLADFLEHVVRVITFFDVFGGEFDLANCMLPNSTVERHDFKLVAFKRDKIEIVQVDCVAGVSDDRTHVARQKIFVFANTEHERTPATRADNEIGNVCVHDGDAVCADNLF